MIAPSQWQHLTWIGDCTPPQRALRVLLQWQHPHAMPPWECVASHNGRADAPVPENVFVCASLVSSAQRVGTPKHRCKPTVRRRPWPRAPSQGTVSRNRGVADNGSLCPPTRYIRAEAKYRPSAPRQTFLQSSLRLKSAVPDVWPR